MATLLDKQQLLARVHNRGVAVSGAQFDDWKREELLSAPTTPEHKGRGRPRLLYPESAVDVLAWLGTHRRFIEGDDVARMWLWLEGFEHITVDPASVLLGRITSLWRQAQREGMPTLPDIAIVANEGMSDELRNNLLDELDTHVTGPYLVSGTWDDKQAIFATVGAGFLAVAPPEWLASYPYDDGDIADALLVPQMPEQPELPELSAVSRDALRDTLATALPRAIEAGQLTRLYRIIQEGAFNPQGLREAWQMLTPETLPNFWPGFALMSPLHARGVDRPKDRGEFMRLLHYDPLMFVVLGATIAEAMEALSTPQPD